MANINDLIDYYYSNHKNKIFYKKRFIGAKSYYIFYIYDKDKELGSFQDVFTKYMPLYVQASDRFEKIKINDKFDSFLENTSKKIWHNSFTLPKRKTKSNGIFGELFLDFYMRIIKKKKIFLTFGMKRSFGSNMENRGYDNVLYSANEKNEIELYLCEAKFVTTISKAKDGLLNDIGVLNEDGSHLSADFLNSYIGFISDKIEKRDVNEEEALKSFLDDLNDKIGEDENTSYVSYLIRKNIKINLVYFAIFRNEYNMAKIKLEKCYAEIYDAALKQLERIGISNCSIEIVFIPTKNESMAIKTKIEEFYEENKFDK